MSHKHRVFGNNNFSFHRVNSFCSNISRKAILRTTLYGSSFVLLLSALLFICPPFHDDSSFATTGTSIASDTTLSISMANPTLSLELIPTSSSGTFATTSSPATIYVATNNITGYTVGIKASSSSDTSSLLVNNTEACEDTPTSSKCSLATLSDAVSSVDYAASTSTSLNNTWGYSPSYYHSVINTSSATDNNPYYYPAPSSTGDVINTTSAPSSLDTTTDTLVPDEYTISLGARLDYTPYAGSYTNTFIITAIGNPVPFSVSYDSNIPTPAASTNVVSNMPTAQTGTVSSGNTLAIVLSTKVPSLGNINPSTGLYEYAGYGFAGWCTAPTEIINDGTGKDYQQCPASATLYQPGDNFGIDQTMENTQILYAVWGYATIITFEPNAPTSEITGTMATQLIAAGKTMPLLTNNYSRENLAFSGWVTTLNGPSDYYANESNFTAGNSPSYLTLYAEWRCPSNSICYNDNGADSPITMGNQPATSNSDVELWPMNYKYDTDNDGYNDYGFAGWSEDNNAAAKIADDDPDNDPKIYGPNEFLTTGDLSSYGVQLYAVWISPATDKAGDTLSFQSTDLLNIELTDTPNDTLANKPINYVTALKDQRDNQVYAVAKLADENYWMIENLRLNNNPTTPNWGNDNLSQGFGGDFIGLAEAESANYGTANANSLYSTNNAYTMPRYDNTNTTSPVPNMVAFDNGTNVYSLGNYYTWAAAIANTNSISFGPASTSICPSNWQLPSGYSGMITGDFSYLNYNYLNYKLNNNSSNTDSNSSKLWRSFPNNFIYSGFFSSYEQSISQRGTIGEYQSSYANNLRTYGFSINSLSVSPGTAIVYKTEGSPIRCLIINNP